MAAKRSTRARYNTHRVFALTRGRRETAVNGVTYHPRRVERGLKGGVTGNIRRSSHTVVRNARRAKTGWPFSFVRCYRGLWAYVDRARSCGGGRDC